MDIGHDPPPKGVSHLHHLCKFVIPNTYIAILTHAMRTLVLHVGRYSF